MIRKNIALLLGLLMVTALFAEEAMNIDGITGNVTIRKNLIVTGSSDLTGDIKVIGNITKVMSTANSKEVLVVTNESVTVNAVTIINGTTTIIGDVAIKDSTNSVLVEFTESQINANKKVVVTGGLVSDKLVITSTANDSITTKGTIVAPTLNITGGLTVDSTTITASKPIVVDSESSLDITDVLTTTDSSVTIKQNLTVSADVTINATGNVTVTADTLIVTGALVIDDVDITVSKPVVISEDSSLSVHGGAVINNLQVTGTLTDSIGTYDRLPKGTILMFGGMDGFENDKTMKGWYICDGGIAEGGIIPNLMGRFIKAIGKNGVIGATGGTAEKSIRLTEEQMPSHDHVITHGHEDAATEPTPGFLTDAGEGSHQHQIDDRYQRISNADNINHSGSRKTTVQDNVAGYSTIVVNTKTNIAGRTGSHQHRINVPVFTGNSGLKGGGVDNINTAFTIEPLYYSLIFIIKMID